MNHLEKSLEKKIQQLKDRDDTLNVGIMIFDLNNLKQVNDQYGHERGDDFIQSFASCLTRITTANSFLARFGGDEFVIIQEKTSLEELVQKNFDLRPAGIIRMLDLRRPIYAQTAAYGHFGRTDIDLPWEHTDKADALREQAGI